MPTIMLVDDSATNRRLYAKLADRLELSAEIVAFASPVEALEWLGLILAAKVADADLESVRWLATTILPPDPDQTMLAHALSIVRARAAIAQPAPVIEQRRRLVLLADDNRTNQQVIAKMLERAGHDVAIVSDGEEALDALEDPSRPFDLVLMDVNMLRLDGLETTQLYRAMALGRPHLLIVALTADAAPDMARRCIEAGMDACLTKPIEPARLA